MVENENRLFELIIENGENQKELLVNLREEIRTELEKIEIKIKSGFDLKSEIENEFKIFHEELGKMVTDTTGSNKQPEVKNDKVDQVEYLGEYGIDKCERVEKVYFLKTSKTGSTTVANILMRFGFRRKNSNFLLGELNNGALFFLNGYMPFSLEACWLGRNIKPNKPIFDFSYAHMRYNKTAVDAIMHPKTKKISILRDPTTNFISSWKYYSHLTEQMRQTLNIPRSADGSIDFIKEIEKFLIDPWGFLNPFAYSHSAYLFIINPQFIFFGKPSYLLRNTENNLWQLVDNWIKEIENDFDHILILEDLDNSLALLTLKFCWSIDDVVHLKLNTQQHSE